MAVASITASERELRDTSRSIRNIELLYRKKKVICDFAYPRREGR
jgi:hypothetical protein